MSIQEFAASLKNTLLYPMLFFIILLILFHVFVYVARPSARFLKKVDYAWLSLAALSIISAASEQRRMLAQNSVQTTANWLITEVNVPVDDVHFMRRLICETPWNVDEAGRAEIKSECAWYSNLEQSWTSLDQALRDQKIMPPERATAVAHLVEQVNVPAGAPAKAASDVANLRKQIEHAKESGTQYLTIVESLQRSDGELFLIFVLP